jgi:hypothetical protein
MKLRSAVPVLALIALLSTPALCAARDDEHPSDDAPSILSYGLKGFWTGAELGLAAGFLATGTHYESREWRKLVLGAGIGAIAGLGTGITLAIVDASSSRPEAGWLMLRDTGYGSLLGALTGAAVGALFWVDGGRAKNVLTGLSIGTLVGAGAGLAFGIIEGLNSRHRRSEADLRTGRLRAVELIITAVPEGARVPALMPMLVGRF